MKRVGNVTSDLTERPQDRADVARFYAASSPSFVFNLAARQVAAAEGSSLSENARALALLNMASNDSLVASFWTKYHYKLWRPETAIREGDLDGNAKNRRRRHLCAVHSHAVFPELSVESRRAEATAPPRS